MRRAAILVICAIGVLPIGAAAQTAAARPLTPGTVLLLGVDEPTRTIVMTVSVKFSLQ